VRLDGQPVEPSLLDSPMIVEPGLHRVEAEAEERKPLTRELTLVAGGSKTVAILFEKRGAPQLDLAAQAGSGHEATRPSAGSRYKVLGLFAGGLGLIGFGTFAVAGLQARSTYNRLQAECPLGCSDSAHRSAADNGRTQQTVANVGLALGIAGTLTAATLLYLGYTSKGSPSPSVEVSAGLVKLSYVGSF
jgi:hypothetical protein